MPEPINSSNILVLPYHDVFTNLVSIVKKYFNISIVFSNKNTIKNILIKNTLINQNSCIYKIPCSVCDKYYIGQTGQSLDIRISQHKGYIRSANDNKSVFVHMSNNNHPIDFQNSQVLKYANSLMDCNIFESAFISHW